MAEGDNSVSDDDLNQQKGESGTIREGTARVHMKLFPKYGFLVPDNPLSMGDTIFFGLTAHVDASKKYIADLREELYPDQKVKFMAVPVERDGSIKWKALVVGPLPDDQQDVPRIIEEEGEEDGQIWLTCRIHPNLQPTHGFATPEGGNQYHDNVYFSLREATDGLEVSVSDLTSVFSAGERIKALCVSADPQFKAKYRALKVCKIPESADADSTANSDTPVSKNSAEDCLLVEETDQSAVSWIYEVLKSKDKIKLTSLAGDLSHNPDIRSVVQPQKKSLKRFLAKYPRFFTIKEDIVSLAPNCPPINFKPVRKSSDTFPRDEYVLNKNWSSEDESLNSPSASESIPSGMSSPILYTTHNLKTLADSSSRFTMSMLANIVKSLPEPMKMSEIFKHCQKQGWEGMRSMAMLAQVVSDNPTYFCQDEKGCLLVTAEGKNLSVKQADVNNIKTTKSSVNGTNHPLTSSIIVSAPNVETTIGQGPLGSFNHSSTASAFSIFSPLSPPKPQESSSSLITPSLGFGTSAFNHTQSNVGINRKAYMPISTNFLGLTPSYQADRSKSTASNNFGNNSFPSSHVLPVAHTSSTTSLTGLSNGYIYHSDNEDLLDDKFRSPKSVTSASHYNEEESQFLSVVARGICPHAVGGGEEVFKMLKKELEALGISLSDNEGGNTSGTLSRHLLCLEMDVGKKPRAKFQSFTPSGKISKTTVTLLSAQRISEAALANMLTLSQANVNITRVGRLLYGINKAYHCIRMLTNGIDEISGCTVSFKNQDAPDIRMSDHLQLGEKGKVKIILSHSSQGTTSSAACASLRKHAIEKCVNSTVVVVDLEGQIFGFGCHTSEVRRMICGSLDMQQRHLKETVHHHPNLVVANSIDCVESLKLLKRINAKGISIYAEVTKSLEKTVRNIFNDCT
uniref:uncharacterized protein LOC120342626 isoform X1 n=1 Tax=Styela clava TaxID=7725 RepID=UPI001939AF0F|nr:uncharacterized protein LOC120342626 isoform X1 [Styela clava]